MENPMSFAGKYVNIIKISSIFHGDLLVLQVRM